MKHPRIKDQAHRAFIASLSCIVCGDNTTVEAAHIRYAEPRFGKRSTGMAEKSHDIYCLPLCGACHRRQHKVSERGYWEAKGIDAVPVAQALYIYTGDHELATAIVDANRRD